MTLTNAPRLETERMILRGPEMRDVAPLADFYADADHCAGFGGPLDASDSWRWFALVVGHWHIHGYGYFFVDLKETGESVGMTGIWNPEGWPEPELGYAFWASATGKGLAFEAASRVRDWAYQDLGFKTLSSHIVPGNTRSEALARRLGAYFESTYQNPHMGEDQIFRHPAPEELYV